MYEIPLGLQFRNLTQRAHRITNTQKPNANKQDNQTGNPFLSFFGVSSLIKSLNFTSDGVILSFLLHYQIIDISPFTADFGHDEAKVATSLECKDSVFVEMYEIARKMYEIYTILASN